MDKANLTCALTGVLTDPKQHPVPVTAQEMAGAPRAAYHAGARNTFLDAANKIKIQVLESLTGSFRIRISLF